MPCPVNLAVGGGLKNYFFFFPSLQEAVKPFPGVIMETT
jgi:hypothetical protein